MPQSISSPTLRHIIPDGRQRGPCIYISFLVFSFRICERKTISFFVFQSEARKSKNELVFRISFANLKRTVQIHGPNDSIYKLQYRLLRWLRCFGIHRDYSDYMTQKISCGSIVQCHQPRSSALCWPLLVTRRVATLLSNDRACR